MKERFIETLITDELWGRQMRFIAGPRQCGKTTLAKSILQKKKSSDLYYNWDQKSIRERYRKNPDFFLKDMGELNSKMPWLCFDEIHKVYKWKNILKGFFDAHEDKLRTIVTGSARLDLFRRSGDSLAGRYFLFHLLPFTLSELDQDYSLFDRPEKNANDFIERRLFHRKPNKTSKHNQKLLLDFSGFPEPLIKQNSSFHKTWQRTYKERTVYEDIRDLSQINNLEAVAELVEILPSRVASVLSINSLAEDIEVNHATAKNYLKFLELSYMVFCIKPFKKNISRSIKSSPKLFFYDWTRVSDPAALFENYIACQLKALTHYWTDQGFCEAELFFIRTRDDKETDFLICLDRKPWLLVEAKLNSDGISKHHYNHTKSLGGIPILQLNLESDEVFKPGKQSYIAPAWKIL